MSTPLISVIVPVYRVEPYLRKCLDSIVEQTYENLEIILVDDGSPDNCGAICDEYAARDGRIKVIHKENGGVSSARNVGLKAASGDWIGWVDSDDWIEADMFAYLLQNALEYDADIAVCSRRERYRDHVIIRGWDKPEVLDTEQALKSLLENDAMQNILWDKLWRRKLYENVSFPEGRNYEDIAVMHRLFLRAKQVCCLPEAKYNYLQRSESITNDTTLQNRMNHFIAARERLNDLRDEWPQYCDLLEKQCVASAIGMWCGYYQNPRKDRQAFLPQLREIAAFCSVRDRQEMGANGLGLAGRMVVKLTSSTSPCSFGLAWLISKLYQIKHGRAL